MLCERLLRFRGHSLGKACYAECAEVIRQSLLIRFLEGVGEWHAEILLAQVGISVDECLG